MVAANCWSCKMTSIDEVPGDRLGESFPDGLEELPLAGDTNSVRSFVDRLFASSISLRIPSEIPDVTNVMNDIGKISKARITARALRDRSVLFRCVVDARILAADTGKRSCASLVSA